MEGKRSKKEIFNQLSKYLTPLQIEALKLHMALKGNIGIVLHISDIMRMYNGDQADENKICYLLSALCQKHFRTLPSI